MISATLRYVIYYYTETRPQDFPLILNTNESKTRIKHHNPGSRLEIITQSPKIEKSKKDRQETVGTQNYHFAALKPLLKKESSTDIVSNPIAANPRTDDPRLAKGYVYLIAKS